MPAFRQQLVRRIWRCCGYCKVCCNEEELAIIEHFLDNCPARSSLELRSLGRDFLEGLGLLSSADIKALHRFIGRLSWLIGTRVSMFKSCFLLILWFLFFSRILYTAFPIYAPCSLSPLLPSLSPLRCIGKGRVRTSSNLTLSKAYIKKYEK